MSRLTLARDFLWVVLIYPNNHDSLSGITRLTSFESPNFMDPERFATTSGNTEYFRTGRRSNLNVESSTHLQPGELYFARHYTTSDTILDWTQFHNPELNKTLDSFYADVRDNPVLGSEGLGRKAVFSLVDQLTAPENM